MFLAFKVGVGAFKVGKIAANTGTALRALSSDVILWNIQVEYYDSFFKSKRHHIPETLYALGNARVEVAKAYLEMLKKKIAHAQVGKKATQMKLIAKASGELGRTFAQDVEMMFASLEETFQMIGFHINLLQTDQISAILKHLEALNTPVPNVSTGTTYLSSALETTVESRRFIFILEWPTKKVRVGDSVTLRWTVAGNIPHCKIKLQTASLMQQAQSKAKKNYITLAEDVPCSSGSVSEYIWNVTEELVAEHGEHGSYGLKFVYENPELLSPVDEIAKEQGKESKNALGKSLVGNAATINLPVKATTDTFKVGKVKVEGPPKESTMGNFKSSITKNLPSLPGSSSKESPKTPQAASPAPQEKIEKSDKSEKTEKASNNPLSKASGLLKKRF